METPDETSGQDAFNRFEAEGWEHRADGYHVLADGLTTRVIELLLDAAGVDSGTRVLDVATGPGYAAEAARLRGADVVGVDVAGAMVTLAQRLHPEIEFRQADAERLPFDAGSFDAVVGNFMILHVGRPEPLTAENPQGQPCRGDALGGEVEEAPADGSVTEHVRGHRVDRHAGDARHLHDRLVRQGQFRPELAYQAAGELLRRPRRPTAILAGNDVTALAVLDAAADLDLQVPDDLAVCGFDDTSLSRRREVALTTVAQQKDEMGRLAVGYLVEAIEDPQRLHRRPIRHVLPPTLVIRGSCGALRARDVPPAVRAAQGDAS